MRRIRTYKKSPLAKSRPRQIGIGTQKGTQEFAASLPRDLREVIESEIRLQRAATQASGSPGKPQVDAVRSEEAGASDPALQEVLNAWPRLSLQQQAAVVAVVRAVLPPGKADMR